MSIKFLFAGCLICLSCILCLSAMIPRWGFYAHKRINRLAVFTLPQPMLPLFKDQIEYLTEHAVDPDKRRYRLKAEGIRHYIDLDASELNDVSHKNWTQVWITNGNFKEVNLSDSDTSHIYTQFADSVFVINFKNDTLTTHIDEFESFLVWNVLREWRGGDIPINPQAFNKWFEIQLDTTSRFILEDRFTAHGILPWHLQKMQKRLTRYFMQGNPLKIIRTAAEIGHYIGDAHVPLHTTENYNGQLTNQIGIHAFWESRIPELFEESNFDLLCGKAEYIEETQSYFWDIILESHRLVDSTLSIEKHLSSEFNQTEKYCAELKNGVSHFVPCKEYAFAYHNAMNQMVERRMRDAISAIGSSWYTAWVDAGSPELHRLGKEFRQPDSTTNDKLNQVEIHSTISRPHSN